MPKEVAEWINRKGSVEALEEVGEHTLKEGTEEVSEKLTAETIESMTEKEIKEEVREQGLKQQDANFASNLDSVLSDYNLSVDEFNDLRLKDVSLLSETEKSMMKAIRESIEMPDSNTIMQKVIPKGDIENYLNGTYNQVGGYVTRLDDVTQLNNYDDIYESLRLDYPGTQYNVLEDDSLGVIRFKTTEASQIGIPYSKEMGGSVVGDPPFTGNGFTKATNGQIIPEFKCEGYLNVMDGAELYEINKDGVETLRAIYDSTLNMFIEVTN